MELLAGPIPGENFTSDIKNHPWHRPPEFDDLDMAIEYSAKKLTSQDASMSILTLLKNDVSVAAITDMYVTNGIMQGKWTVDYALLMAGPISEIIALLADGAKVKYRMGIEDTGPMFTNAFFEEMEELTEKEEVAGDISGKAVELSISSQSDIEASQSGFMGSEIPETSQISNPSVRAPMNETDHTKNKGIY